MVYPADSDATLDSAQPVSAKPERVLATTLKGKHLNAFDTMSTRTHGWSLVVIRGSALGQRVEIGNQSLVIGRTPECGWVLEGGGLSRRHCTIWPEDGRLRIRDHA